MLEPKETNPRELTGAPSPVPVLLRRPVGSWAPDLDGKECVGGMVSVGKKLAVPLSLLVPPFLKLIVLCSRH